MSSRTLRRRVRSSLGVLRIVLAAGVALGAGAIASCGADSDTAPTSGSGPGGGSACSADCSADPAAPVCDPATGQCVACLPTNDVCPMGQYCASASYTCEAGCGDDADCDAPLVCRPSTHTCVSCVSDTECPAGSVCDGSGTCVSGCSPSQPCANGLTCCAGACQDVQNDPLNCGGCGQACPDVANATEACAQGICALGACDPGFLDCNQTTADGCEQDESQSGPCSCVPGETMSCYQGPLGTEGVGPCVGGTTTCQPSGTVWGPCVGQVLPFFDACADGIDNDCDGTVDNTPDQDGDGWTQCDGDCCDSMLDGCGTPNLVNPGAFEVDGNMVDDDCDGVVDNVLAACDAALASNSGVGLDYAKAIDLCATTVETPPTLADKKWGVISASFFRANGSGTPAANSRSIRQGFGSGVTPLYGSRIAVLSTGVAAAQTSPNNTSPSFAAFQGGQNMGTTSGVPADWLAANGNNFPNAPGCPDPQNGTTANDPIMLKLRVRVPTNANSFSVSTFFYSSEYPEWVCSPYNDFFLTLLDSTFVPGAGQAGNPADKNLAFYDPPPAGAPFYPVGVNLAFGNTGLFNQCLNGPTGCGGGSVPGSTSTCTGITQLLGTGFDITNPPPQFAGDPGWCGSSNRAGGGTGWLTTNGNVAPGETIEIRFVTWDTGDPWYDSVALLDNFQWSVTASTPGTHQ